MKIKISELTGCALDREVAKCEGRPSWMMGFSTEWEKGGPIIEREKLGIWWATHVVDEEGNEYGNHWYCETGCTDENANETYCNAIGPTPLIAAMRCYVASKLGAECDIPDELITGDYDDRTI